MARNDMIYDFKSIKDFEQFIFNTPLNEIFRWQTLSSSKQGSGRFNATASFEEALELMRNGWDDMSKKLEKQLTIRANEVQPKTVNRAKFDVAGFQASVPRYLQGIPTSMVNKKPVVQKQKVITLVKSIDYHAGVDVREILEHSIRALQIVKKVEAKGFRVNLDVLLCGESSNERLVAKVRIKSAAERLNVSKVAFPMVNPDMLRRMMFRLIEVSPEMKDKSWTMGYGRPIYDEAVIRKYLKDTEFFLPSFIHNMDEIIEKLALQ